MRNKPARVRYTEVGRDWNDGNSIGIQHIYPGSQIGLDSPADLLQTGKNMVQAWGAGPDGNGTVTFYPPPRALGHDPSDILTTLLLGERQQLSESAHSHGRGRHRELQHRALHDRGMLLQCSKASSASSANWPSNRTLALATCGVRRLLTLE